MGFCVFSKMLLFHAISWGGGVVLHLLRDKIPRGVGFVNDFLRGSPDCPGSREAGRRTSTSMELSQNCFTKPTLQGILSVSSVSE